MSRLLLDAAFGATNAVHAALGRELKRRPPMSDLFGRQGRAWLGQVGLPGHERRIVESCLREIDFLSQEAPGSRSASTRSSAAWQSAGRSGASGEPVARHAEVAVLV